MILESNGGKLQQWGIGGMSIGIQTQTSGSLVMTPVLPGWTGDWDTTDGNFYIVIPLYQLTGWSDFIQTTGGEIIVSFYLDYDCGVCQDCLNGDDCEDQQQDVEVSLGVVGAFLTNKNLDMESLATTRLGATDGGTHGLAIITRERILD